MLHLLNHTFKAKVWNFLCHPDEATIFIETRDESTATVTFSAINLRDNNFLFKEIAITEDWWCSMVATSGDVLLIHLFTQGRNPDPSAVLAFDFKRKKILWKSEEARFESSDHRYVNIWKAGQLLTLDLNTGDEKKSAFELDDLDAKVVYPLVYSVDNQYYPTLAAFIKSRKKHEPESHIEYLELPNHLMISYYTKDTEGLAGYLMLLNKNGEEQLFETLGRNFVALGWNAFFVYQAHVVFVKNKVELNIYRIS